MATRRRATEEVRKSGVASFYTSSAMASNVAGTARPSVLAVCRLMTNSNLVGRDWEITRLFALENTANVDTGLAIAVGHACAIAH